MPLTRPSATRPQEPKVDWADPGYFSGQSRMTNAMRVLVQLVRPPRGHRTVPTKTGLAFILLVIGVGTAAFNTGQNILYLALAILLSTLLLSGILSWLNFKGCQWRLETGRHFRVGEASPVYLHLLNTKKRLPSYALTFRVAARNSGQEQVLALDGRIDPGQRLRLMWEYHPRRRGPDVLSLDGLESRYPFGFLRKSIQDSFQREIVVWPERIKYQFAGDQAGRRALYGRYRRKGEGVDLRQLRRYRSGDPLKHIHWKASARMGSLQVRETEQEHHQAFSFSIDPSPHLWQEEAVFEKMCALAASLAEDLYKRDQLKQVRVVGEAPILVGAIEDLYTLLDRIARLERRPPERGQSGKSLQGGVLNFSPGVNGTVLVRLEEVTLGQA